MKDCLRTEKLWRNIFRYVLEFWINGFIGWIYEVTAVWLTWGYFENRGILYLPIIPIYAVGGFILLILIRKKHHPVFLFVVAFAVTTVFELGASYLLEFIFHRQFWTYSAWPLSILDRSSAVSSAVFGILAVGYFYIIHPVTGKISDKMPLKACMILSISAGAAVIADLVIFVIRLL